MSGKDHNSTVIVTYFLSNDFPKGPQSRMKKYKKWWSRVHILIVTFNLQTVTEGGEETEDNGLMFQSKTVKYLIPVECLSHNGKEYHRHYAWYPTVHHRESAVNNFLLIGVSKHLLEDLGYASNYRNQKKT